jgi:hypothetical protein
MEFTRVHRATEHRVNLTVVDCTEQIQTKFGSETLMRPEFVSLRWSFDRQKGWELRAARLTGPNIRKDGSESRIKGSRDFEENGDLVYDTPSWLRALARDYEPHGTVLIP